MPFPKVGLYYEDARARLLKYESAVSNPNMRDALIDDACQHEGEGARRELAEEFVRKRHTRDGVSRDRSDKSSWHLFKGKKLGAGRYTCVNGRWQKKGGN